MNLTSSPARPTTLLTGLLAAVAVLMSTLVGATPAQAADSYSIAFAPKNGTVGVSMDLTSTVSSSGVGVGEGTVTYYASGAQIATAAVDTVGKVAAAKWTPPAAGVVPMYAAYLSKDGTATATSVVTNVTFAQVATKTTLEVPGTAKVSSAVTLTATVVPAAGAYVPTGTVTFQMSNGAVLASANLDKGVAKLNVQMPSAATSYQVKAVYNGDTNATASTSGTEAIQVTTSGSVIDLTLSAGPYAVGKAMTLTAVITPSSSKGSVSFKADATVLGAVAVDKGKATLSWKPTKGGAVTLTASFTPSGSTKVLGTDTEKITVASNLPVNAIVIGPVGQTPWKNGQSVALRYASTLPLGGRTSSGAPVNLAIAGSCSLDGATIVPKAGAGTCTLTSTSPATNAYTAGKQTNTIVLARGKQTAALIAPATRSKLKRYRTYLLARPDTRTNAGNTVTWKVTYGKKRCKVTKGSDGTVFLRAKRTKLCKVRAYAPPAVGQWLRFKKVYRYYVRR